MNDLDEKYYIARYEIHIIISRLPLIKSKFLANNLKRAKYRKPPKMCFDLSCGFVHFDTCNHLTIRVVRVGCPYYDENGFWCDEEDIATPGIRVQDSCITCDECRRDHYEYDTESMEWIPKEEK